MKSLTSHLCSLQQEHQHTLMCDECLGFLLFLTKILASVCEKSKCLLVEPGDLLANFAIESITDLILSRRTSYERRGI